VTNDRETVITGRTILFLSLCLLVDVIQKLYCVCSFSVRLDKRKFVLSASFARKSTLVRLFLYKPVSQ